MKNAVRDKILQGKKVLGTFFELGSCPAVECLGFTGLDFIIIDTEHGPFDVESASDFIRASERRGITPFVRVKDSTRPSILKMLDVGAMGLVVPCIGSADEARRLVEYGKYYPLGNRGFAPARRSGWGMEPFAQDIGNCFETCNRETMIIPQCETRGCLEEIEEVAAIPGIDGVFVGPYDLSVALGKPAQFSDPVVTAAIAGTLAACKAAGKPAFIYAGTVESSRAHFEQGFEGVAYGMDAGVLIQAFRKIVADIQA